MSGRRALPSGHWLALDELASAAVQTLIMTMPAQRILFQLEHAAGAPGGGWLRPQTLRTLRGATWGWGPGGGVMQGAFETDPFQNRVKVGDFASQV